MSRWTFPVVGAFLGAAVGATISITQWRLESREYSSRELGGFLLPFSSQDTREHVYSVHVGNYEGVSKNLKLSVYRRNVIDRLGECIAVCIVLGNSDRAMSLLRQESPSRQGEVLYHVLNARLGGGSVYDPAEDWANDPCEPDLVEFIASALPVGDDEWDFKLALLLAKAYEKLNNKEAALCWLDEALKLGPNRDVIGSLSVSESDDDLALQSRSIYVEMFPYGSDDNEPVSHANEPESTLPDKDTEKTSAGRPQEKNHLRSGLSLTVALAAIGFVLATILKPVLDAVGRTVVGPVVARLTRQPGMLRHFSANHKKAPQATGASEKPEVTSKDDKPAPTKTAPPASPA